MPTASHRPYRVRALGALCALGLLAAACGDDDDTGANAGDTPAEGETASGDFADYCAATAELDEQDGPPTAEQMERIKELAPDEISSEVEYVADAFIEADGDMGAVFADPQVEEDLDTIEDWEAENCDGGGEFAVAPEYQEYCSFLEELDGQSGPPDEEQLLRLKEIRPDTIGEETDLVVDAVLAADGNIGEAFGDPEVAEAFSAMEAHDAEHCGSEGGDEEMATEPLEGAEVIEVIGVDFEFEGIPDEVPDGDVSFEFANEGEAAHEMIVFKLGEGADMEELLARDEPPGDDEAEMLGIAFAPPGEGGVYVNLEGLGAGTYAVVCFIPGPEGKAHHELGMKQTFTVS